MFEFLDKILLLTPGYILIMVRLSGMMVTFPIFSNQIISRRIRSLLVIVIAFLISPAIAQSMPQFLSIWSLLVAAVAEFFLGAIIGFGTRVIFESFTFAGLLISRQMGLMLANVMDPSSSEQRPLLSQFWFLVMTTIFLVLNAHHIFLETMVHNFQLIPLMSGHFPPEMGKVLVLSGSTMFTLGMQYAAPGVVLLLLTDSAIGLMAKMMPQMNIFIVALPLKIGVGLFTVIISINIFQMLFDNFLDLLIRYITQVIQLAGAS
ncbi:MAG TPA: flagellar biosynthetic protein FliR [Candidatus Marinimicrobia bacterium]|nr:flagellar biosynthetic protein FliR [Candidatus Neomarinimicrobiota bacterium]